MAALDKAAVALVIAFSLAPSSATGQQEHVAVVSTEALQVSAIQRDDVLEVRWRSRTIPLVTPESMSASVNGKQLQFGTQMAYPQKDSRTHILFLLDTTDPRRDAQMHRDALTLFAIASSASPHHDLSIATYSDGFSLLAPDGGNTGSLINQVVSARPRMATARLSAALEHGMNLLKEVKAERKAIFVLSDGHFDDPVEPALLALQASATNVALTFILSPSERQVDLVALSSLARNTGGSMVADEESREGFLSNPFALIDSGGMLTIALQGAYHYRWESEAQLQLVFRSEEARLALSMPVGVPIANIWQHIISEEAQMGGVLLACAAIIIGGIAVGIRHHRKRSKAMAVTHVVASSLGSRSSGVTHAATRQRQTLPSEETTERIPSCEEMWRMLKSTMHQQTPDHAALLTPIQMAEGFSRTTGDNSVVAFIEQYYYPRTYGSEGGSLTDAEAFAIVKKVTRRA